MKPPVGEGPRFSPPRFVRPTKEYAGYIFDCDGTLADTMPIHHEAWRRALREGGANFDFDWPLFVSRAGMTLEATVVELSQQFNQPLDPYKIAGTQRRYFAELEHSMVAIDEVLSFAREVAQFAKVSVASGSLRKNVLNTLARLGATELFEIVVTPEDVAIGKPHPDMFLLAARQMGVRSEECLVIEDAEFGFEAARRAGMDFVRVESVEPTQTFGSHRSPQ